MQRDLPETETIGGDLIAPDNEPGAGTELWLGRRIAREHGSDLKYVWEWRSWVAWQPSEGRWQRDAGAAAYSAAKQSVQRLLSEASNVAGEDVEQGKLLLKAARKFMGRAALESALKLAQSEAAMIATPDEWDTHPHLLNCANGTVDLRDGTLRPHRREDRLTKTTGVKYRPDAAAPRWIEFLERILPEREVREYVQRALGYTAIGSVTEHDVYVAWGGGANGKSTLFGAAGDALGDYAVNIPPSLLLESKGEQHPTAATKLFGARLAVASETPENGWFHASRLKALSGADPITARRMREDFWQFDPTHSLWVMSNYKPKVRDASEGFWRRIRLIPFTVSIPKAEQDGKLPGKLRDELQGILAWIVAGTISYQLNGLSAPAAVMAATAEYQADQDELREYVERYEPGGFTSATELHTAYLAWAAAIGVEKPWGQRTLTAKLKDRGWEYVVAPVRGFSVCVPKSNFPLNSREDTRVSTKPENCVSNAIEGTNPHSKRVTGDSPNAISRSSGPELAGDDPDGDLVDRLIGDAP